jgi:hypothetical protein
VICSRIDFRLEGDRAESSCNTVEIVVVAKFPFVIILVTLYGFVSSLFDIKLLTGLIN